MVSQLMPTDTKSAANTRHEAALADGHGKVRVLSVGVSSTPASAGFSRLSQCTTDAEGVHSVFMEVRQLNADLSHLVLMTAKTTERPPTRGMILQELRRLAAEAQENDRILFYFSGHGHRISGITDHFLVPSDVYDSERADALVSMNDVRDILSKSVAKQKVVILDACLSGPTVIGRKIQATKYSSKFFTEYLKATKSFVILSSSQSSESSYAKSPNPSLSLLTHFVLKALRGEPDSLDGQILTITSLFDYVSTEVQRKAREYQLEQKPSIENITDGVSVLADFRKAVITAGVLNLNEAGINSVFFIESYAESTGNILTRWENKARPISQLQYAANSALEEYLTEDFGQWKPKIRRQFNFSSTEIKLSGGEITFPGCRLIYEFENSSKSHGTITRKLILRQNWLKDTGKIVDLLNILNFRVESFGFTIPDLLSLDEQIAGLEANEWDIETETDEQIIAEKSGITMTVTMGDVTFVGFDIKKILSSSSTPNKEQALLAATLQTVAPTS